MLSFMSRRKSSCQDLQNVVRGLNGAHAKLVSKAKNAHLVGETLYKLIQSEAPSFSLAFERIRDIYRKISRNYEIAADEQARAIDDLNDIVVRFAVVDRLTQARETSKKNYDAILQKYKAAKAGVRVNQTQVSLSALQVLRAEQVAAAKTVLSDSETYLEYRTRFDKFVKSRSASGWTRFGASLTRMSEEEASLMSQLAEICRELRDEGCAERLVDRAQLTELSSDDVPVVDE